MGVAEGLTTDRTFGDFVRIAFNPCIKTIAMAYSQQQQQQQAQAQTSSFKRNETRKLKQGM